MRPALLLALLPMYATAQRLPRRQLDSFFNAQPTGIAFCIRQGSATKGDGGVYTSLNDYGKWMDALQRSTENEQLQQLRYPIKDSAYYAAGWFLLGDDIWFHSGSTCGFNNYVIHHPAENWTLVFFSDQADNEAAFRVLTDMLNQKGIMTLHDLTR